jgi:hypothetical protein
MRLSALLPALEAVTAAPLRVAENGCGHFVSLKPVALSIYHDGTRKRTNRNLPVRET